MVTILSIVTIPSDPSPQPWVPAAPGDAWPAVIEVTTVEDDKKTGTA